MAPEKICSLGDDRKPMMLRIVAQNASLMQRLVDLLTQNQVLLTRIADLEAKLGTPPKTPDNSSLPPLCGQKSKVAAAPKQRRKGHPGVARELSPKPDVTRNLFPERCQCGRKLGPAGQQIARLRPH